MVTRQCILEGSITFWYGQAMWALDMLGISNDLYYLEQFTKCEQLRKKRSYQLAEHKNILTS